MALGGLLGGVIGAGTSLIGAGMSAGANYGAGAGASRAGQDALSQSTTVGQDDLQRLSPWTHSGQRAAEQINALLGLSGTDAQTTAAGQFRTDPGYAFRMQQGVNALDRSAAARGTVLSGAQAKALNDYGQNTGSAEYGNYFNRLAGVSGQGLNASVAGNQEYNQAVLPGISDAFQGGLQQGRYDVAGGNAQAAGVIGAGNSLVAGLGSYGAQGGFGGGQSGGYSLAGAPAGGYGGYAGYANTLPGFGPNNPYA